MKVESGINYRESLETFPRNPGRGHAIYPWIVCLKDGETRALDKEYFSVMGLSTPMYDLSAFSAGNGRENNRQDTYGDGYRCVAEHPERVGGVDREIDADTMASIEFTFKSAKAQGIQLIPRFAYAWNAFIGCEPSCVEWIKRHIKQLCPLINKYAGTVIAIEGGMYGPWGEMHSSKYAAPEYAGKIVRAWLENLDPSIGLLVRNLGIFSYTLNTDKDTFKGQWPLTPDSPIYRLGLYNDGYLGDGLDTGTFTPPSVPETEMLYRTSAIEFMRKQNERLPYGGEFSHVRIDRLKEPGGNIPLSPIYGDGIIKELYDTHLSYLRNIVPGPTVARELGAMTLEARHDFEGMPDISAYKGVDLQKFILDHMGYRFVIREAYAQADAGKLSFCGKVENVGFGNELGALVCELILEDEKGRTAFIPAPVDLRTFKTREITEYSISADTPSDFEGKIKAYLRFGSMDFASAEESACTLLFANEGIHDNPWGANYIGSI